MSNKKRIQKKISKSYSANKKQINEAEIIKDVTDKFLKFLRTYTSPRKALSKKKSDFKTGRFIKSNPDDKEIVITSVWKERNEISNYDWMEYLRKQSRIDYNFEILNNPVPRPLVNWNLEQLNTKESYVGKYFMEKLRSNLQIIKNKEMRGEKII